MTKGCVHIHIKDGDIRNIFCHLSDFPENGVVHLKSDQIMTEEEITKSHPYDANELSVDSENKIYNLGKESV